MNENIKTVFVRACCLGFFARMSSWSENLRTRARDLGLSDVDVARRLGLAQGRYSAYINQKREPDLNFFVRICAVLGTTPDVILGVSQASQVERPALARLIGVASGMTDEDVELTTTVARAIASRRGKVFSSP